MKSKIAVGAITFHASHNYGSNLQAFALQFFLEKNINCKYEIINYRTEKQKEYYKLFFEKSGIKNFIKSILLNNYKKMLYSKFQKHEDFINSLLHISKEYNDYDELVKYANIYDYYISGSDQIWNLAPIDFDWAYYLEFVNSKNKISYATSFGPKNVKWDEKSTKRVINNLYKFKSLSVREEGSYNNVKRLIGVESVINVDPTLLLNEDDWNQIIDEDRYVKSKYIFLYDLKSDKNTYRLAKKISKKLGLPIVVAHETKYTIFSNFIKTYDAGPKDFLNLIKNANLILSTSFHGTVFSIIFKKPFYAINSVDDYRICTLLKKMSLTDRLICFDDFDKKIDSSFIINFEKSVKEIQKEVELSKKYLFNALEIKEDDLL